MSTVQIEWKFWDNHHWLKIAFTILKIKLGTMKINEPELFPASAAHEQTKIYFIKSC